MAEVGARGANRRRVRRWPRVGGRVAEQLCLEVAPSILIDFICAHVSESERHAGCETQRESRGCFRGSARRVSGVACKRERMKEGRNERKRKGK